MSYRPRARAQLAVDLDVLAGALPRAGVDLGALTTTLLPALDGERDVDELVARFAADGHERRDVETALRWLLCVSVVEGAGDAIVDKIMRVQRGELRLPTSLLEGARFECQSSGECCQNYAFGPIDDEDLARLDALDLKTAFPALEPPYVVERDGTRFLRSVGDRCIFLSPEGKCGLHAKFGGDSKPRICRLYPLTAIATIEGMRLSDMGSCATFAVSARSGLPLLDDLERVRKLLPTRLQFYHPIVFICGTPCDYGHYLRFTTMATTLIKRKLATVLATLQAIGRGLAALAAALAACPLEPGQPDAIVAHTLADDPARWYGDPAPEAARAGAAAISEVAACLLHSVVGGIGAAAAESGAMSARLLREIAPLLHVIAHVSGALGATAPPPDAHYRAIAAVEAREPEIDEVLRLSMRQQLFGAHSTVGQHAPAALLRIALMQLCALYGARMRAAAAGRRELWPEEMSHGHMLAARVLEHKVTERVLLDNEDKWSAVLDGLALVARQH